MKLKRGDIVRVEISHWSLPIGTLIEVDREISKSRYKDTLNDTVFRLGMKIYEGMCLNSPGGSWIRSQVTFADYCCTKISE